MYKLNFVESKIAGKAEEDKVNCYENDFYIIRERIYDYENDNDSCKTITIYGKEINGYLPEIYVREDMTTDELKGFEIVTTSWGTLSIEEMEEKIKGYQIAIETVKELNKIFLNK